MATFTPDIEEMKDAICSIACNIDAELYRQLWEPLSIPEKVHLKFNTATLYFIEQLLNKEFKPWHLATCLRALEYSKIAYEFEDFATEFHFVKDDESLQCSSDPKVAMMDMLKYLKSNLTNNELYGIRDTNSTTFEKIFSDFLVLDKLTPSLDILKTKLKKQNREDLATHVSINADIIATMHPVTFSRTVRFCLDTIDIDIVPALAQLRDALFMEHSTFHTLEELEQTYSLESEYINLTFTSEVDTRTLPLTEGSDAELQTLAKNYIMQVENEVSYYINPFKEIYSTSLDRKFICLIGHPGTGKSIFCRKLINRFATRNDDTYRFVLLIACRDSRWNTIEEDNQRTPHLMQEKFQNILQIIIPIFSQSKTITKIILETNGRGLLLIIDSFDEFPQHFKLNSTLLFQILKRQFLPECTLLITSRPGAWNQLTRSHGRFLNVYKSWQVLGFSVEQRDKFIETMLYCPLKRADCFSFLSSRLELKILSLVPINISLITSLIANTYTIEHIHTLTELYTSLILFTMDRQMKRVDEQFPGIHSLHDMPAGMLIEFQTLTKLSYDALLKRQITFSSSEFPSIQSQGSKYTIGLGLFHIIRVKTGHQTIIDHLSAPHMTFQEYLAAWHLSDYSTEQLTVIIKQLFKEKQWPAIKGCIRFLLGLRKDGHAEIVQIIIDNIDRTPVPLLDSKLFMVDSKYNELCESNTSSHISLLPFIVETKYNSIITNYYNQLILYNSTAPHFYLRNNLPPIEINSLYQFVTILPPTCSVSVLRVNITQLNSIQMDMLQKIITTIHIDILIVRYKQTISNNMMLINLINNISSKTAVHTPKQVYYHFENINFKDDLFTTDLITCISPTATNVKFDKCKYTPKIMALLISSLTRLENLHINALSKVKLHNKFFQKLIERNLKVLFLRNVELENDSILYEYLQSQSTLEEIHLDSTTDSTLDTLQAIKHLPSLQYFYMRANDDALNIPQSSNTEESMSLFLDILNKNCYTLSYADFSFCNYLFTSYYADIMQILSLCSNLKYICFWGCSLAPAQMRTLGTTINQLHELLYIIMTGNREMTADGIFSLSEELTTNNSIIWITLFACCPTSTPSIIAIMRKCVKLQKIVLFCDPNSEEYVKLKQLAELRKIDLQNISSNY